jgi:RHH-type transcriptional regulator, proline utilization regulon repressor / proline dehydrogenase / delta 1-pyrroline-5-carboxylate dehydrogenase
MLRASVKDRPQNLPDGSNIEEAVQTIGGELLERMARAPAPSFFSKKGAYARLMEWSMQDPAFKTQLFRFVDVLPSLRSSREVVQHLQEYLGDRAVELHPGLKAGLAAAGLAPGLVAGPVKAQITSMAREFVAGETPADLVKRFEQNAKQGVATTIDLLGETVVSASEADAFVQRNLDVLSTLAAAIDRHPAPCHSDMGPNGPLPRLNLSVKISALTPDVNPTDPEGTVAALKPRLRHILRKAQEVGAFINFDMESYRFKAVTLSLFKSILEEPAFQTSPAMGIAVQAYLRDAEADLRDLISWAREHRRQITVRLVKGAYWDYETIIARQRGWPIPVWLNKAETDLNYEQLSQLLLDSVDAIQPAFATHNARSCAYAIAQTKARALDPRSIEFQALYGMADDLKLALLGMGYRVREYCPIGDLLPGMAYLVRRLLENTSNEGFLRLRHLGQADRAALLANPAVKLAQAKEQPTWGSSGNGGSSPPSGAALSHTFLNAPNTDFSRPEARASMRAALKTRAAQPARVWPLVIDGGNRSEGRERVASINPAHPERVVGYWTRATVQDAEDALAAARAAQGPWARANPRDRAACFLRLADLLERERFGLAALEVVEAGKPWIEADADVSEAVDFCRFYAREAQRLGTPRRTQATPGESNTEIFVPRGVTVVIAPWNFPLAILCGMTVAAAVGGNSVVMKPAEQTCGVAAELMRLIAEAGVPAGVINLVTGFGEDVGAHLVSSPGVDVVAFTGSRAVGLKIWETVGRTLPGQQNLKKAICEMGGKNPLIVDSDADWDEAIPAVLYSAFGFSGQKCSALSRLILHDEIADEFTARLIEAAAALQVGDPAEPGTIVGPVIDADAHRSILARIETGRSEAKLAYQAKIAPVLLETGGYYVAPTIFTDVPPTASIAREEIFGPVLSIMRARDLDHAIELANDSAYALTAGIFSRSPSALVRAARELNAGNVYLNRPITGAIVERHPFGGYKMSGGGTKAGGRGYLEQFLFARTISENTLRRGFSSEGAEEIPSGE